MPETIHSSDPDEINLFELLQVLASEWRTWVGTTLAGAALAVSLIFFLPPKYEASAIVRVGQVGQVGQGGSGATAIESLPDVVERIQSAAFRRAVAEKLLGKEASPEEAAQIMARLKAAPPKVLKGTNLVEINASGQTPDEALKTAQAILENLAERHRALFEQAVEQLKSRLLESTQSLAALEKAQWSGPASPSGQGTAFVQLAQLAESNRYASLRSQQFAIENALLPLNTRPTQAVEGISVGDRPVSPKKPLILIVGVLAGAVLGGLAVFVRRAWRDYKALPRPPRLLARHP